MNIIKEIQFNKDVTIHGTEYLSGQSVKATKDVFDIGFLSHMLQTKSLGGNYCSLKLRDDSIVTDLDSLAVWDSLCSMSYNAIKNGYLDDIDNPYLEKKSDTPQNVDSLNFTESLKFLGVELSDLLPVKPKPFNGSDKEVAVLVHAGQSNGEGYPVIANVSGLTNVFCATRSGNRNGNMVAGRQDIVWDNYDSSNSSLGGYKTDTNNLAHQVAVLWQAHVDAGNALNLPDLYLIHICWGDSGFGVGYGDGIRDRWSFDKAGTSVEHLVNLQRNVIKSATRNLMATKKTLRILGYVWVHGGYDAKNPTDTYQYESQLRRLVSDVDDAFGSKVPFFPIRHNSNSTSYDSNRENINRAFESILGDFNRLGYMLEPSDYSGFIDESHLDDTNQGTTFTDTVHYSGTFFDELGAQLFNELSTNNKLEQAVQAKYLSISGGEIEGTLSLLKNIYQSLDNSLSNLIARNSGSHPALYTRNKDSNGPIQQWESGDGDVNTAAVFRALLKGNGDFETVGKIKGEDRLNLYKGTSDGSTPDKRIGFKYEANNDIPSLLAYDEVLAQAVGMYISGWSESTYAMKAGADRSVDFGGDVSFSGVSLSAKVNQIVGAVSKSIKVMTLAERDALIIESVPTFVYVKDDGDGKWALYLAEKTGDASTFVKTGPLSDWEKVSDKDLFNANMSKAQIEATVGGEIAMKSTTDAMLSLITKKSIQVTFGSKYAYTNGTEMFLELNDTGPTFYRPPYSPTGWKITGWSTACGTAGDIDGSARIKDSSDVETQVGNSFPANSAASSNSADENITVPSGGFSVVAQNTSGMVSPVVILYMEEA